MTTEFKTTGDQDKLIEAINSKKHKIVAVESVAGSAKAQPNSEPILTPNGWTTMGKLKIGDTVIGSNGESINVIDVHPQGVRSIFTVTFVDGTSTRCDLDHLWTIRRDSRNHLKAKDEVLTLREIINDSKKTSHANNKQHKYKRKCFDKRYKTYQNRYRYSIQSLSCPVSYDKEEIDTECKISPFILGVLISDGSLTNKSISFTSMHDKVIDRVRNELHKDYTLLKVETREVKSNNYILKRGINVKNGEHLYINEIRRLKLNVKSPERFIPDEYIQMNKSDNVSLYDGLTWTDGYWSKGNITGRLVSHSTASEKLAIQFGELARDIGVTCSPYGTYKAGYKKNGKYIECKDAHETRVKYSMNMERKSIINIKFHSKEESTCIVVDADDSLYVTDGHNLTHNSSSVVLTLKHKTNPYKSALILAFNSKISKENKELFPSWCDCRTIHSLAYKYIVSPLKLKVKNNVDIFDIASGSKITKEMAVKNVNNFCKSSHLTLHDYLNETNYEEHHKSVIERDIKQVIADMESGKKPISHNVYIKLFQLHLAHGTIDMEHFEFIFADEFQDFNGCMYSIFMNLPMKNKAVAFDRQQQIYGWAGAINSTEMIKDEDGVKLLSLSKSFRCSTDIAKSVNNFCNDNMSEDMTFKGSYRSPDDIKKLETFGYQFRTNKAMITAMLEYQAASTKFVLARSLSSILGDLLYVKIGASKEYEFRKLNGKNSEHFRSENMPIYHEYVSYKTVNTNPKMSFALWLSNSLRDEKIGVNNKVARTGSSAKDFKLKDLLSLREYCSDKKNQDKNFTIMTAFGAKGLSIDCVMIDGGLNKWTEEIIEDDSNEDEEELYLYYVACTRAKKCLIGADLLKGDYYGSKLDIHDFNRFVEESQSLTVPRGL